MSVSAEAFSLSSTLISLSFAKAAVLMEPAIAKTATSVLRILNSPFLVDPVPARELRKTTLPVCTSDARTFSQHMREIWPEQPDFYKTSTFLRLTTSGRSAALPSTIRLVLCVQSKRPDRTGTREKERDNNKML